HSMTFMASLTHSLTPIRAVIVYTPRDEERHRKCKWLPSPTPPCPSSAPLDMLPCVLLTTCTLAYIHVCVCVCVCVCVSVCVCVRALCSALLCCAVLCCAVLCCAVLCSAVLCCAVL